MPHKENKIKLEDYTPITKLPRYEYLRKLAQRGKLPNAVYLRAGWYVPKIDVAELERKSDVQN